jgi:hypothetical protein
MRDISDLKRTGSKPSLAFALLRYAASKFDAALCEPLLARLLQSAEEREFQWLLRAGWGALLFQATRNRIADIPLIRRNVLTSEDLTARVRSGNLADTASQIIAVCGNLRTPATLLKGISVSDQYYPSAHLRPMGDIDILVEQDAYHAVEAALLDAGYLRDADWPSGLASHHHGAPLFDPVRRVWVELHTGLFHSDDGLRRDRLFGPSQLVAQSVASSFHGRPVNRLSDELQLVYIATSWMRDLMYCKIHPSHLNSLLDVLFLLQAAHRALNWDRLFGWLDKGMAAAYLYVTLDYVASRGLHPVAPAILSHLASRQRIVGALQLWAIQAMLDRYLLGGRPWTAVFPPPVPGRYSVAYQLRKRLRRLLAGSPS